MTGKSAHMLQTHEFREPPAVAVVIPCYNYAAYVTDCIGSVAAQTYNNIDLLIYDDGSTDGSGDVIKTAMQNYADRFRHVDIDLAVKNRGKLHALNTILPRVSAPITVILDADDTLNPDFLTVLANALIKAHEATGESFAYCDCKLMNANGETIAYGNSMPFNRADLENISYIPDCAPTMSFALKEVLPFDTNVRVSTKHHKWLSVVNNGHTGIYVNQRLFNYRMHHTNMSGIGTRVMDDLASGAGRERILSEYWSIATSRREI